MLRAAAKIDDQQGKILNRKSPACVIAQLARSVLDSLCQDLHAVSWHPKPLVHNRREQTNLSTPLTQNIVYRRGANDGWSLHE